MARHPTAFPSRTRPPSSLDSSRQRALHLTGLPSRRRSPWAAPPEGFGDFAGARAAQFFRIAFLMCNNWHEAEDLVQVTLAKVYVAWSRLRRSSGADSHARTVMLNTFLSQRRLKRSGEIPAAEIRDLPAPRVDADLRMTPLTALSRLPPRGRAVVVLRYVEDHSIESVAAPMGTTPAAVKSMNARGLAQLRELLGADEDVRRS